MQPTCSLEESLHLPVASGRGPRRSCRAKGRAGRDQQRPFYGSLFHLALSLAEFEPFQLRCCLLSCKVVTQKAQTRAGVTVCV